MERIFFELAEVQAFIAVADKLNFKAAADSVFISQPALSRRIDKLETQIGARLLERTTRHVALTEAGQRFLEHARAALEELQLGVQGVTESTVRRRSVITVACVPSVAFTLLPMALKEFSNGHPDTRIRLIDEGAQEVLASVLSGAADFGINFIGTQEPEIEFRAIYSEEYRLAVRDDHPLADAETVSWEQIANERFISVAKTSGNRTLMDNALGKLAKRPVAFHEAKHVAGALGLVEAGLGIAAIPALALPASAHPRVRSLRLCDPTISRTLGLITKKGQRLQAAASALYEQLLSASEVGNPQ